MKPLRISLLHLAPVPGEINANRRLLEHATRIAASQGAGWVVSPELAVCGYGFRHLIGTDWIMPEPGKWMSDFCELVKCLGVNVFLSHPERDPQDKALYNSVFFINSHGAIAALHRKINSVSDGWSSPGNTIEPFDWNGTKVGILLCADAYTSHVASTLKSKAARILVSPAAWGPGLYGPSGEWEQRTLETGLPLIVCNRTGEDSTRSFGSAESLVVINGKKVLRHTSPGSVVLTFDWDLERMALLSPEFVKYLL
jgi:predicted amidohydrolase